MPHYNPNQPRVPQGQANGGEWTAGASPVNTHLPYFSPARRPERAEPDGVQTAFRGPPVRPVVKTVKKGIEAALAFFTWLSTRNTEDQHALAVFRAREYPFTDQGEIEFEKFEVCSREKVNGACQKFAKVQDLTDEAAKKVNNDSIVWSDSAYGSKVHAELALAIGTNDPNLKAEVSILKTIAEAPEVVSEGQDLRPAEIQATGRARYGQKGTIRIDVYDWDPETKTVCIYDIKTGRSILTGRRMAEIAATVRRIFPDAQKLIVAEIRPNVRRRSRGRR